MTHMGTNVQANNSLLNTIHKVVGFDPAAYAVEYTDLYTGEIRKRLPVMAQMAWFRLVYPEGKISVSVSSGKDCSWPRPGYIPATRILQSAIWLRLPPPAVQIPASLLFPPGNGHRRQPLESPFGTQASDCSSVRQGMNPPLKHPMSWMFRKIMYRSRR